MRRNTLPLPALALLLALAATTRAATFRAFSLKAVELKIKAVGSWWRVSQKDILHLGQINTLDGMVYDSARGDVILVGRHLDDRARLTLDDLVVALRARLRYNKWPLVRPDVIPESPETRELFVRMEGGIANTAFAQDLVAATDWLATLGAGLAKNPPKDLRSCWDRVNLKSPSPDTPNQLAARLWLFPFVRKALLSNGVCIFSGFDLEVYPQVIMAAADGKMVREFYRKPEPAVDDFAKEAAGRLDDLYAASPALNRLRGLYQLVVAAEAVSSLRPRPDLSWWLMDYPLKQTQFSRKTKVKRREQDAGKGWLDLMGATQLAAIVLAPEGGNVASLKRVVLATRGSAISWHFAVARWAIPGAKEKPDWDRIPSLFTRALWLRQARRYDEALKLYGQAAAIAPRVAELWCGTGDVLYMMGRFDQARDVYQRATQLRPDMATAWSGKALALTKLGLTNSASQSYNRATELNPMLAVAWSNKGVAYGKLGQHDLEMKCYDRALKIDPGFANAWCNKGVALGKLGKRREAVECFVKAVQLEPSYAKAWYNLGALHLQLKRGKEALACIQRAAMLGFGPARRTLQAIAQAAKKENQEQEKKQENQTKPPQQPKPKRPR